MFLKGLLHAASDMGPVTCVIMSFRKSWNLLTPLRDFELSTVQDSRDDNFFFCLHCTAHGILVPQPGIRPCIGSSESHQTPDHQRNPMDDTFYSEMTTF